MKKMLMGFAACAAVVGAASAAEPIIHKVENSLQVIPTEYTVKNQPMVYTYTGNNDSETREFTVFDENFQEIKTFTTAPIPSLAGKEYIQERQYAYRDLTVVYTGETGDVINIDGNTEGISIEQALELVRMNCGRGELGNTLSGEQVVVVEFWNEWEVGQKYPQRYFAKNEAGVWAGYVSEYSGEYGPFGDWGEVREEEYDRTLELTEIEFMTADGGDTGWGYLTQAFFGDDESIKYCIPVIKTISFSEESETWKRWGDKPVISGFKVLNDKNEEVSSITLPSGYYAESSELTALTMGGSKYIIVDAEKEGETNVGDEGYIIVYRIDGTSAISAPIAIQAATKVSPKTPRHGERVTVTLGDKASKNGCNVSVVSTNGQTMMSTKVAAGESAITLDTSRLQKGMYVVTVNSGAASTEAAKIVVR
ncbi:MAG: T9SS type A sorting domain-containing protein [Bacteroides sp.]|nr:T9SS type A sorting domain-containing protein [Bacteroides sp.]